MRLGVIMGLGDDWKAAIEKAKSADDLGYELLTSGEAWNPSILPFLTLVAANTSRIQIGSSILNCFSRTPATLAQEFAVLDPISQGRMVLGIGGSGAHVIEHFHGIRFERPLRRLRETIEIFDLLIAGEKLNYEGEIFQLARGFQLEYERPRTKIPVYVASITPRSIRQTAQIADGIFPIHWPKGMFGQLRKDLCAAAGEVGRDGQQLTIAPYTTVGVLDGQNDEAVWTEGRRQLCLYINQMGKFYWQALERNGFAAEVKASRDAWAQRDKVGAMAAISERMIREIQVIGPIEACREQLQEREELGADVQLIYAPQGEPAAVAKQLEALVR